MPGWAIALIVVGSIIFLALLVLGGWGAWISAQEGDTAPRPPNRYEKERQREWERWKRGGQLHQASRQFRDMQPHLRIANGLPPIHDEDLFHD
jgi:hypothetical protein